MRRLGVEHTNDSATFSILDSSPESSESEHETHWMRVKNVLGFGKKEHRVYMHDEEQRSRKKRWKKADFGGVQLKRKTSWREKLKGLKNKILHRVVEGGSYA